METTHTILFEDARSLAGQDDDSVDLVVTSPPYPMIEMWDEMFATLNDDVATALDDEAGDRAFEAMHTVLDDVWDELQRVLAPGGIACINIGNATRTIGGNFELYPNNTRITRAFRDRDFTVLPDILWRKPTNSTAKFMGSGMIPSNAYVTLEHEHILVFRNGDSRSFPPKDDQRYESAYFWEERNDWFSDVWTDLQGVEQALPEAAVRDRSAAYPFELPYRLINMFSVYGDTVLDPFWGTGTTSLAAMVAGRNSVGVELDDDFQSIFDDRVTTVYDLAKATLDERLAAHRAFADNELGEAYEAENYDFQVRTQQERDIQFYLPESVSDIDTGYRVTHEPYTS